MRDSARPDNLVEFRNRAGFHADKPRKFFDARRKLRQSDKVEPALLEFEKLFRFCLGAEAKELPELEAALDSMLDEFEKEHGTKYQRQQFKAYLMITDTAQPHANSGDYSVPLSADW